jgi:hypothetical protein
MTIRKTSNILIPFMITLFLNTLWLPSCSDQSKQKGTEIKKLSEAVHGFYLGEERNKLFARSRNRVEWKKLPTSRHGHWGELYYFSKPLKDIQGTDHARLAFLDDRLMEAVIYYKRTDVLKLRELKRNLEKQYGIRATSPDGTIETVYKTYRFRLPGMSVTLRRITKIDQTELCVQYLHGQLNKILKERKEQSGSNSGGR